MASHWWVRRKRQQLEEYLEGKLLAGEITKEEAQKKYEETIKKLKAASDDEIQDNYTLNPLE